MSGITEKLHANTTVRLAPRPEPKSPAERLSEIAETISVTAESLQEASEAYELSKQQPPSTEEADLLEGISAFEARLSEVRTKLEAVRRRGTPLMQYEGAAELAERAVEALVGNMLTALVDRDLLDIHKVSRKQLSPEIVKTHEAKYLELRNLMRSSSLWRRQPAIVLAEENHAEMERRSPKRVVVSEEAVQQTEVKTLAALEMLTKILNKNLPDE
jgi:hypothetical protein